MTSLSPSLAADLAQGIYELLNYRTIPELQIAIETRFPGIINKNNLRIGLGKTGTLRILKSQTAFAFAAQDC